MRATEHQLQAQILEQGNIVFLYRPKGDVTHPAGAGDVERVYFMLLPDDQEEHKNRIYNVAHGLFPASAPGQAGSGERVWAFAQEVDPDPRAALERMQEGVGAARIQRAARRSWARVAGEGRYAIARREDRTYLAYALARPEQPGEVQKELHLLPQGSFLISVKDPHAPSEIDLGRGALYPPRLQSRFVGRGWIPVEPTGFLDYPHTQVQLMGAGIDVEHDLGLRLQAGILNTAQRRVFQVLHKEERQAAPQGVAILEPLEAGRWA